VACIGGVLILAERRRRLTDELRLLAGSSAAALASIDVIFSLRGRISKLYLVDATIEIPFAARCLPYLKRATERSAPVPGKVSPSSPSAMHLPCFDRTRSSIEGRDTP
jgi:hypothetical protein